MIQERSDASAFSLLILLAIFGSVLLVGAIPSIPVQSVPPQYGFNCGVDGCLLSCMMQWHTYGLLGNCVGAGGGGSGIRYL